MNPYCFAKGDEQKVKFARNMGIFRSSTINLEKGFNPVLKDPKPAPKRKSLHLRLYLSLQMNLMVYMKKMVNCLLQKIVKMLQKKRKQTKMKPLEGEKC